MDGNKVQSLRQQFEVLGNYTSSDISNDKSDSKYSSAKYARIVGAVNVDFHPWCQMDRKNDRLSCPNITSSQGAVARTENSSKKMSVPSKGDAVGSTIRNHGGDVDGLFVSGNRRNGIYVSNSITLNTDVSLIPMDIHSTSTSHRPDSSEHMNEIIVNNVTLNSSDVDIRSRLNNNVVCVSSTDDDQRTLSQDLTSTHIMESESQSNTHPSSASNSTCSTMGVYGRVKRSNAFRQKDLVDCVDSRFGKTKIVLDRVKSLDTSACKTSSSTIGDGDGNGSERTAQRAASVCLRPNASPNQAHVYDISRVTSTNHNESIPSNPYKRTDEYGQMRSLKPPRYVSSQGDSRDSSRNSNGSATPSPSAQQPSSRLSCHAHSTGAIMADAQYGLISECQDIYAADCGTASHNNKVLFTKEIPISQPPPPPLPKGLPPEKPPRTFLYDILSDNQSNLQQIKGGANTKNESNKLFYNSGNPAAKMLPSIPLPVSTCTSFAATRSQISATTNNKSSNKNHVRSNNDNFKSNNDVFANANARQINPSAKISNPKIKGDIITKRDYIVENARGHNCSSTVPIAHNAGHPVLIRSKTESQIIIRNKNRPRPTAIDTDMIISPSKDSRINSNRNHFNVDPKVFENNFADISIQCSEYAVRNNNLMGARESAASVNINQNNGRSQVRHSKGVACAASDYNEYTGDIDLSLLPLEYRNSHQFTESFADPNTTLRESCSNDNVSRSLEEAEQLSTKSKSEWALNDVGCSGKKDRRNTVANMPNTGFPSLDSTVSSNSSTNFQNSTPNPNSKMFRSGIQQSIQNLMNQLFPTSTPSIKDATSSTDSGIQLGSDSLSSCDTPMGDSTTDTGDSDCENDMELSTVARQVVEARKGYIRRVSSIRMQELGASLHRMIQNSKKPSLNGQPLFECIIVVGLNRDPYKGSYHPYIREIYPSNIKLPDGVEQFCFPDSLEWPCHEGISAQFYTLAITDQRGSRKYGCCYRILPEGASICIPITYCLISSNRAIGFYKEVLREITVRHGLSEYQRQFWMEELYKRPFPNPGESITIQEPVVEEVYLESANHYYKNLTVSPKTVTLRRRADHRLDEGDLVTILSIVDLPIVIKLFGSLLLERKVVLISRALSNLSLCVEALESMMYPFSWQHTFVPILPLSMTDVLDAPAPFLIGVLRSSQTPWEKTLDEGIVVDIDNNKVVSCVGDEATILPKRINKKLRDALQLVLNLADQKESTKNVLISECFIRMFVETLGHYSSHITVQQGGVWIFDRDSFTKHCDSKATQNFLEWFSETSMFHEFLELRLKNPNKYGLFEQRIIEQSEQLHSANSNTLSKPGKLFMKGYKPFGSWLKETFVMK